MIGQFARASVLDCACPGRGLGRWIVNLIGEARPALLKTGTRTAAAVSSAAARAPGGQLDVQRSSSVNFSRSVPFAGCLAVASGEESDPHFSEKCELTLVWELDTPCQLSPPASDSAGWEMAHCSSCSDAGIYHRAQPPDLTTPRGEGNTSLLHQPQPALHGRGRDAGVPHSLHLLFSPEGRLMQVSV